MTSVEAYEPALPPLEMMSGIKSTSTTAFSISFSKPHRGSREHFSQGEDHKPSCALLDHAA
jgi:hypothetical protein